MINLEVFLSYNLFTLLHCFCVPAKMLSTALNDMSLLHPLTSGMHDSKYPLNNNNNNSKTMFMVLSSRQSHCEVHPVHLMNVEQCQAAVDPRPSQTT